MSKVIKRLARWDMPVALLPLDPPRSRRAARRVATASMDLSADIAAGRPPVSARGQLLDVSPAGCCIRLARGAELTRVRRAGLIADGDARVTLPTHAGESGLAGLIYVGKVVAIDDDLSGTGTTTVHVRFRPLPPTTRHALLRWVGELMTRAFQERRASTPRTT